MLSHKKSYITVLISWDFSLTWHGPLILSSECKPCHYLSQSIFFENSFSLFAQWFALNEQASYFCKVPRATQDRKCIAADCFDQYNVS